MEIVTQRLTIEEIEALEACVSVSEDVMGTCPERALAASALSKLRAVVPIETKPPQCGNVMNIVEKLDQ